MSSETYLRWSYRHFHSKLLPHTLIFLLILLQTRFVQRRRQRNFKQLRCGRSFSLWDVFFPPLCSSPPFFFIISLSITKPNCWCIVEANKGTSALPSSLLFVQMKGTDLIGSDTSVGNFYNVTLIVKIIWGMIQHVLRKQWKKDNLPFTWAHISVWNKGTCVSDLCLLHSDICTHTRSEENSDSNWNSSK